MKIIIRSLIIILLLLGAGTWFALHTNYIQQKLTETAQVLLTEATGEPTKVEAISLDWRGIYAQNVRLGKSEAPWLKIEKALVSFSLKEIVQGIFTIKAVHLDGVQINALPSLSSAADTSNVAPLSLPFKNAKISRILITSNVLKSLGVPLELAPRGISGEGRLQPDGSLSFTFNNLHDGLIRIGGTVGITPQWTFQETLINFQISNTEALKDLISLPHCNEITIQAALTGALKNPHVSAVYEICDLTLGNVSLSLLNGSTQFAQNGAAWTGEGKLNASYLNTPIYVQTKFSVSDQIILNDLMLNGFNSEWHSDQLTIDFNNHIEGSIKGAVQDLAVVNNWLEMPISGRANITLNLGPKVDVRVLSKDFLYYGVNAQELDINISADSLYAFEHATIELLAHEVSYSNVLVGQVQAQTTLDPYAAAKFSGFIKNDFHKPLEIKTSGTWQNQGNRFELDIREWLGHADDLNFSLSDPVLVTFEQGKDAQNAFWNSNKLIIPTVVVSIAGSTLQSSLSIQNGVIDASLQVKDFPLTSLNLFSSALPALKGKMSLNGSIQGSVNTPDIRIEGMGNELVFDNDKMGSLEPALANFLLAINSTQGATVKGKILIPKAVPLELNFHVPMDISISPFIYHLPESAPLNGRLKANGELRALLEILLPDFNMLSGHTTAELKLEGTVSSPLLSGVLDIENGKFEIEAIGTALHDLKAHFEATGSQLKLTSLSARDSHEGIVTGQGLLKLDVQENFPFELDLNVKNVLVLNQDYLEGTFSGNLVLSGDFSKGALKGKMRADQALFTIPEQPQALMNYVDVTYVNLPPHTRAPQLTSASNPAWPLTLDIDTEIPKSLTIEGKGLSSEWKGEIKVSGLATALQLFGEIKIIKGTYLFNGKPFDLNQGAVTFSGDIDKKMALYIIASKDLGEVKVDVILKGPVLAPIVSFRSNPPLPQREILSWLLFGRGTSEISPFQGSQLTESIGNLDHAQSGPDILTKIRNTLGIDRIEFGRSETSENGMSVQVGKYLSDRLFISLNKSDVNRLAIEASVTDRIKLQAEVGDDSQGKLFLRWKKDY